MSSEKGREGLTDWVELWETFHRIREDDPSARDFHLASLNDNLRQEVQELLEADSSSGHILEGLVGREMEHLQAFLPEEEGPASEEVLADRFKVVRLLGKGGMGTVYEAWDQDLQTTVALKILRPDLAQDASARERFHREIHLARRITHPNACRIFDLFHHNELLFLTMELLPAETLHHKIKRDGRMHPSTALPIIQQVADALMAIHSAGIVHRDLKTSNIMLVPNGNGYRAVVTDFGLAVTLRGSEPLHVTQTGQVIGTPEFMAPEQLTKGPITPATDVYALGLVMYEMITGQLPLQGESPLTIAARRISEDAPSPRRIVDNLERNWERTILQCLERDPKHRFQTAAQAAASLNESSFRSRFAPLRRRRKPMTIAILILLASIFAAVAIWQGKESGGNQLRSDMVDKRLWTGGTGMPPGALSTDGKTLIDIDWKTADLMAIDLDTGKKRLLTNSGVWFHPCDFSTHPTTTALSPDGKEIAYGVVHPLRNGSDLRVVDARGGAYRTIRSLTDYGVPLDWSPDSQQVAVVQQYRNGTTELALVSIRDSSIRTLKRFESSEIRKLSFSPDGKTIAYDAPQQRGSINHDLFLFSLATGNEARIVADAANDYLLGWAPDGASVLFASDRAGTYDAWKLGIVSGRPAGFPQLLKKDIGQIYCLRITADGSLYYQHMMNSTDIYMADMNGSKSTLTLVSHGIVGSNRSPEFSTDGKYLIFQAVSNPLASRWSTGAQTITLKMVSLESNQEKDFVIQLKSAVGRTRWSPDGRTILLTGESSENGSGLYTADITKGTTTLIVPNLTNNWVRQYYWSADGKAVYYLRNKGGDIVLHDLATGADRIVCNSAADFALSVDGKSIAAMTVDIHSGKIRLNVLPSAGGPQREIMALQMPEWISAFSWTPDRHIVFLKGRRDRIDEPHQLWRISADSGAPEDLRMSTDYAYDIRVHPDGKRIAVWSVIDTSELWVLQNFLPQQ